MKTDIQFWKDKLNLGIIDINEFVAIEKYFNGDKLSVSTFIDEVSISIGYGKLSSVGIFFYELPIDFRKIENIYGGCSTWEEWYKYNKSKERKNKLKRILKDEN